jgi:hypothetical protein
MKKFMTYFTAILFIGVISLSVLAFSDDDPKQQKSTSTSNVKCDEVKTTATTTKPCSKHMEATAAEHCDKNMAAKCDTTAAKACCKNIAENASAQCPKAETCEHHKDVTAEAK